MKLKITKMGNSCGVRLPREYMKSVGEEIEFIIVGGKVEVPKDVGEAPKRTRDEEMRNPIVEDRYSTKYSEEKMEEVMAIGKREGTISKTGKYIGVAGMCKKHFGSFKISCGCE